MGGHLVRCNLSISQMVCERERLDIELRSAYEKSYEITNLNPIFIWYFGNIVKEILCTCYMI